MGQLLRYKIIKTTRPRVLFSLVGLSGRKLANHVAENEIDKGGNNESKESYSWQMLRRYFCPSIDITAKRRQTRITGETLKFTSFFFSFLPDNDERNVEDTDSLEVESREQEHNGIRDTNAEPNFLDERNG